MKITIESIHFVTRNQRLLFMFLPCIFLNKIALPELDGLLHSHFVSTWDQFEFEGGDPFHVKKYIYPWLWIYRNKSFGLFKKKNYDHVCIQKFYSVSIYWNFILKVGNHSYRKACICMLIFVVLYSSCIVFRSKLEPVPCLHPSVWWYISKLI